MLQIIEIQKRRLSGTTWHTSRSIWGPVSDASGAGRRAGVTRTEAVVGRPAKSPVYSYQACKSTSRSAASPASGSDHGMSSCRSTNGSTGSANSQLISLSSGVPSCGGGKPAGQEAALPFPPAACRGDARWRWRRPGRLGLGLGLGLGTAVDGWWPAGAASGAEIRNSRVALCGSQ